MTDMNRREALATLAAAGVGSALSVDPVMTLGESQAPLRGRLRQSVSRWCYERIPFDEFCRAVAGMGLTAIDLLQPEQWPIARDHGLICSMGYGGGGTIPDALNNPANHDRIVADLTASMPLAVAHGVPNLITFFGSRRGMSDAEAIRHCVAGLERIKPVAEEHGITICVELLNSKVDHEDYQGDRTAFGVDVVRRVDSPRVKLLYDIYHMQIMEGDVIRTIRDTHEYIAHYHTGGVPGRHELDDSQELNWRTICRAIAETGFTGYLAHEFVPTRDPLTSLREAVALCDV